MAVTVSRSSLSSSSYISLIIKITASAVVYIVYSYLFVAVGISATCYHNSFVDNVIDFSNMEVIRQLWLDSNTFRLDCSLSDACISL